jgi:acyl-CoA synthetase (AMP-forming)/AMP-acid ligase II/alkylation response protein AidB-like acyl-CoA dehydrogenase/acyl carrier protein
MMPIDPSSVPTLTELLRKRASAHPDALALRFFERGEQEARKITYGELDTAARAIAALLGEQTSPGDRVLLMFPPGLDFLASFCACLYAGVIAVPAYPPDIHRLEHAIRRLQAVIDDAQPKIVLTTADIVAMAQPLASAVPGAKRLFEIPWLAATDDHSAAAGWKPPTIASSSLAFLQYTSGSTGNPKGAMLSHGNLLGDLGMLAKSFGGPEHRPIDSVCWVPLYHDLGLIGHALTSLYTGGTCNVISPIDFLKKPIRWLRLLSETRAPLTGAPNFAFDLCLRKITSEEVTTLDLSHVEVIGNCAEPVRARTIERFHEFFAPAGLKRSAINPCYGLAEATVMVTSTSPDRPPLIACFDEAALGQHRAVLVPKDAVGATALVGSGRPWGDCEVIIASPSSGERARQGQVGEIWVRGSNVAGGYWGRADATRETFGARLDGDDRTFLRTGDLGFIHEGELFVTGRLKDLVIVRGRNLYPQDVERAVDDLRSEIGEIRVGCSAAIAWTIDDREELVFLQEVSVEAGSGFDPRACASEIRRVIFDGFEVQPHEVVLVRSGSIPKTSSGKIMRSACREAYGQRFATGGIEPVYRDRGEEAAAPRSAAASRNDAPPVSIMSPGSSRALVDIPAPGSHAEPSFESRRHADDMLEWLRSWAAPRFDPLLADTRRSIAPHVILDLGNAGVMGMRVPSRWGGAGLSNVDAARVIQQLAALDITLAAIVGVNNALGIHPLVGFARPELREELLPDLARGRKLAAFALTERGAGSNPLALEARATGRPGGPWRLEGEKIWIGLGSWAGVVNVFVKNHGGVDGVSAFALAQPRRGLRVGPEAMTMGVRSMVQSSILLEGVEAGERELLGVEGRGFDVASSTMTEGRMTIAAAAVGGMKRALQLMARYAERRTIGTGSLFDNPVTRERMAQATFGVLSLEALVTRLATLRDGKAVLPAEVFSAAKVAGSELLWSTADHLVQLLGGRGYMENNDAARLLRDARLLRIFEGPSETLATHLGASVLAASDRWKAVLSGSLRAPRTALRLARAADELKAALGERPAVPVRRLTHHRAGMLLCWALLSAALEGGGGRGGLWAQATGWLSARFDDALSEATAAAGRAKDLPSTDELRDMVGRFAAQIGDLELPGHGEDLALDSYLRKTPAAVAAASPWEDPEPLAVTAPRRSDGSRGPQRPAAGATPAIVQEERVYQTLVSGSQRSPDVTPPPAQPQEQAPQAEEKLAAGGAPREREVEAWFVDWVSATLGVPTAEIKLDEPLTSYGVDSLVVVEATSAIEERFGLEVAESIFWNHRTIRALSTYIGARLAGRGPA